MTDLLYQTDSYLRKFTAKITEVDEVNRAVCSYSTGTVFYPGGVGKWDMGTLAIGGKTYAMPRARKGPEGIWHSLGGDEPLPQPEDVTLAVDIDPVNLG